MKRRAARRTTRRKINRRRKTHRVQRGGEVRSATAQTIKELLSQLNQEPTGSRLQARHLGKGFFVVFDNVGAAIQSASQNLDKITGNKYINGAATGNTYDITDENISHFEFEMI